jgi:aconitate hydratase
VVEIDLSALSPHINGPHTPDLARPVSELGAEAEANGWPLEISAALVGSCTNSSYQDITRAADIARQAAAQGLRARSPLLVTPGSEQVRATIERDGLLEDLESIGATVLANACGPCIGQWDRPDIDEGVLNSIVTSYNRNFPKRNDGYASTLAFVTSPETVVALSLAGRLDFDPATDPLINADGDEVRLTVGAGEELPADGFDPGRAGLFQAPPDDGREVDVEVSPTSRRLQVLEPFTAWDGRDLVDLPVLMKAQGKCTTDHISMAGPWLAYRGHLENISGNLYLGVVNAHTGLVGTGLDITDGEVRPYPEIARRYHEAGIDWVAVGDENIGEGSSREHAAMEPRFRGCRAVLARSFARIHETNLKKQGVLPLTFADPGDYDLIGERDRISVMGLDDLTPVGSVRVVIDHDGAGSSDITACHTMSDEQIGWFRAGSALNLIRQRTAG